ncbi:hypothetical protein SZ64_15465 [Erythrobacter sp. SG61-1L]|uniref:hypothetical protein n=1 Tax=Erythrobacter sp. SG61-1L TaxID=1603897 RepID=UPI0006C90195|nr:hypothetical protein [Erythrobacter sp. SG61-1L]KPL69383.1 hypothetical protein SZ64_15465 [Erythrobacter sp. SG61-1L]
MPLYVPQIALALAILLTAATGIWLLINARAVARLFRRSDIIQPGPALGRQTPPPRRLVLAMLAGFTLGWVGSVAIWSWAMTEEAVEVVDARASGA